MLATFIKKRHSFLSDIHKGFIPYFAVVALILGLLALQPDF